jgi:hypothetical protein
MPKHEPEVIAAANPHKLVKDPKAAGDELILCCPGCGYQYLHNGIYDFYPGKESSTYIQFSCTYCGEDAQFDARLI